MSKGLIIGIIVASVALLGGAIFFLSDTTEAKNLDGFTKCLKEKKAIFYGAFWCPHCQKQKRMFGSAQEYLPYVECSTPDGKGQLAVCKEKNIEGYPTWEFADGTRKTGEVSLEELAEKTSCKLPE